MKETIKLSLPENISDITLEQSKRYFEILQREDIDDEGKIYRVIKVFTGMRFNDIKKLDVSDYEIIVNQINLALNTDVSFNNTFEINGVEYGCLPDIEKMSAGEYIDLRSNLSAPEFINKVIAILFRPIVSRDEYGDYEVEEYTANKKYADIMNQTPMNIVNGVTDFILPFIKNITEMYVGIYGDGVGGSEKKAVSYFEKWGWYVSLDRLAGGDPLKIEAVTELPVHAFHIALEHSLDRQKYEASIRNKKAGNNITEL